ncbi:nucleoside-diphosphate sugar epimerase/dehydratase [Prevotella sp. P6B4]|uniref:polysaccharide biosynthesis protein n=1 Tax=Prevotella sp. P6B4 TaxID=1410614 RepID=UPI000490E7A3|nr:nucleoside-diphosphate sugar epimerase/dehydratase [Prevotella sp. P6B4]
MRNPFDKLLNWYFTKNSLPYWCILLIDCVALMFCGFLTFWIFHNAVQTFENTLQIINTMMIFMVLSVIGFRVFHTYSGFMRYSSFVDLMRVVYCNAMNLGLALLADWGLDNLPGNWFAHFNTTSICLIFIINTLLMWALRIFVKTLYDVAFSNTRSKRILIYGALSGGVGLAKYINSQRPRRYIVKGFISHNQKACHQEIMGEKVYPADADLAEIIKRNDIEAVLVCPYRVKDFRNNQHLQDVIIGAGAKILMTQGVVEIDAEHNTEEPLDFSHMQLHEVSVEELLPRSEIHVDMKSVGEFLVGQRVLVTGAAGSIGSEICRQVAKLNPAAMLLIDQAETPEHDIRLMMQKEFPQISAETVVTSICKEKRMEELFKRFRPDYVFHAAAYKHVPMMEDNPSEAVQNNIFGTKVIADLSVKYGVKKFVMVSTDKAVNPTNVMGCSKRICEIYVQSLDLAIKTRRIGSYLEKLGNENSFITSSQMGGPTARTQFVTTRFGNVLGSNGSVIPLFREQIKNGGPVTVTDERIVRFFMLIPEACKLVLEAGTKGNGGEIFVFDMGQPVKIADLAKRMIKLSGAKNVEVKFTGLRPGEKLYEEVLNELEGTKPTFHEKIRIAEVREYAYDQVCKDINELIEISQRYDDMATVAKMKQIVPEYKSNNSIYEKLDV